MQRGRDRRYSCVSGTKSWTARQSCISCGRRRIMWADAVPVYACLSVCVGLPFGADVMSIQCRCFKSTNIPVMLHHILLIFSFLSCLCTTSQPCVCVYDDDVRHGRHKRKFAFDIKFPVCYSIKGCIWGRVSSYSMSASFSPLSLSEAACLPHKHRITGYHRNVPPLSSHIFGIYIRDHAIGAWGNTELAPHMLPAVAGRRKCGAIVHVRQSMCVCEPSPLPPDPLLVSWRCGRRRRRCA